MYDSAPARIQTGLAIATIAASILTMGGWQALPARAQDAPQPTPEPEVPATPDAPAREETGETEAPVDATPAPSSTSDGAESPPTGEAAIDESTDGATTDAPATDAPATDAEAADPDGTSTDEAAETVDPASTSPRALW